MILKKSFYNREPGIVAKELLGNILVKGDMEGKIVETEAYYGMGDPSSRAHPKKTSANKLLWNEPGTLFLYMVHGYWLLNIIVKRIDIPSGILLRAVEPLNGLEVMRKNRSVTEIKNLTSGPGKLTQAFEITHKFNGQKIYRKNSPITINKGNIINQNIHATTRVGVREKIPKNLRFYIPGNPFVSKP